MDVKLHKQYQTVFDSHWWFKVRARLLSDILHKYSKKGSSVLDFGCNYGNTVRLLQSSGYNASGVDVSREAIEYGREIGITNIFLDGEKQFDKNSFDVAIALDVFEHIEDDKKSFEYLSSLVKPGGIIVIMVPAYMFLWTFHDEVAQHFRRYTKKRLKEMIGDNNQFEYLKLSYFNTFLFPFITIVRIMTKVFNINSRKSDFDINNKTLNSIFFFIFDMERRFLKYTNFPFGVSVLAVIRKK